MKREIQDNEVVDFNREIFQLKLRLNKLAKEKEIWFNKKEDLNKEISELVKKIKEIKSKKDEFNKNIKELKNRRDKYNGEVKALITKIKNLNDQKNKIFKKKNFKGDFLKVEEQIKRFETKIETEALSFLEEKRVMLKIKKLKKELKECKEIKDLLDRIKNVSNDIERSKEKADEFHKKIQTYATDSQKEYQEFIKTSKRINELNLEQEIAFKKFLEVKKEFGDVNDSLKKKLIESSQLENKKQDKTSRFNVISKFGFWDKNKIKQKIEEKVKTAEEKLKNGKKLTTEDFIALQEEKK